MSFHKLDRAKDPRFWSVRVGSDIRLIVHKSPGSLLLCYVDHHDKAYAWAERRKLEVHPTTGAAQFVEGIDTKKAWASRWDWLDKMPTFTSFDSIDAARLADGVSLALLRPKRLIALDITQARNPDWTDGEREKLLQEQMQGNLFSEAEERKQVKQLRKVPFDFHYRYVCDTPEGEKEHKHKIVDWEAGALFWKCRQSHGVGWEAPFRAKLEEDLPSKELMFLMGNQHRFQDQWLIVSLIYPPKRKPADDRQGQLF
jgi:hypothetical protein